MARWFPATAPILLGALALVGTVRAEPVYRTSGAAQSSAQAAAPASPLPRAGTPTPLPPGDGMATVRSRCLICHAPDMVMQQRLTERQWAAEIDKMQRWGAPLLDQEKPEILRYLVGIAGPENAGFEPRPVAPIAAPPTGSDGAN